MRKQNATIPEFGLQNYVGFAAMNWGQTGYSPSCQTGGAPLLNMSMSNCDPLGLSAASGFHL